MDRVTNIMPAPDLREDWKAPRRSHRRPHRWAWIAGELRAHPARLVALAVAGILAFGGGAIAHHPEPSRRADGDHRSTPSPSATSHRPHRTAGPVDVTPTGTPETATAQPSAAPTHTTTQTPHRTSHIVTARPRPTATATRTGVERPTHPAEPTTSEPTTPGRTHSSPPTGHDEADD